MEIQIQIQPEGDTTPSEIAAIAAALRPYLQNLPEVESVGPVRVTAPEGAMGWVETAGALALKLIPGGALATSALDAITAVAKRPGSPPFTIEITADGGVKASFDPKIVSIKQFIALVASLRQQA